MNLKDQIQKDKFLKYGDYIFLRTNDIPHKYLAARSKLQENLYAVSFSGNESNIDEYPNQAELIFRIFPKLYYQAYKKFQLYKSSFQKDKQKNLILKTRLDAEADLNNKRILNFMGEFIRIGDQVQIYHVFSQSYIKETQEINEKEESLFNSKLTETINAMIQFTIKINPYMNFKKDGERISYEDSIYFQNIKQSTVLGIGVIPIIDRQLMKDEIQKIAQKKDKYINPKSNLEKISIPCIENLSSFEQNQVGHTKEKIQIFQANFLHSHKTIVLNDQTNNSILYGNYIRMKSITSDMRTGQIYSEINITGYFPRVYLATNALKVEKIITQFNEMGSSIFQILPSKQNMNQLGKQIKFSQKDNTFGQTTVRFKHVLSGRYLKFDNKNQSVVLSQSSDSLYNSLEDIQKKLSAQPNDEKLQAELKQIQAKLQEFNSEIQLTILNYSLEEDILTITSIVQILTPDQSKYLKIESTQEVFILPNMDYSNLVLLDSDYYKNIFVNIQPLGRDDHKIMQSKQSGSYIFFSRVQDSEITDILTLSSSSHKFQNIYNLKSDESIIQAKDMLIKLGFWLCNQTVQNINIDPITQLSQIGQVIASRQNLIRESGFLDTLINILIHLYMSNSKFLSLDVSNERESIEIFVISLIEFLKISTMHSYANCVYLLQWYTLLKTIILDSDINGIFRFDVLLNEIICYSQMNFSFSHDISPIGQAIKFEQYNLRAINLLTGFCQFNQFSNIEQHKIISEALFENEQVRDNIFRQLYIDDDGNIYLIIKDNLKFYINNDARDESELSLEETALATINLAIEIAKGGDYLALQHIRKLYNFDICKNGFQNENIPFQFRSLFLELLIECYINVDCKYYEDLLYPQQIQLKGNLNFDASQDFEYKKLMQQQNEKFQQTYFTQEFNLKTIINTFLIQIQQKTLQSLIKEKKVSNSKNDLNLFMISIFSLCNIIIQKGFYDKVESIKLKQSIFDVINKLYLILDASQDSDQFPEVDQRMCKWMIMALYCLKSIEDIINNEIIKDFYKNYANELDSLKQVLEQSNQIKQGCDLFGLEEEHNIEKKEMEARECLLKIISEFLLKNLANRDDQQTMEMYNWMNFGSQELTAQVINYIDHYFNFKTQFIEQINKILEIDSTNKVIYQKLLSIYHNIHFQFTQLQIANDPEQQFQSIQELNNLIGILISYLYPDNANVQELKNNIMIAQDQKQQIDNTKKSNSNDITQQKQSKTTSNLQSNLQSNFHSNLQSNIQSNNNLVLELIGSENMQHNIEMQQQIDSNIHMNLIGENVALQTKNKDDVDIDVKNISISSSQFLNLEEKEQKAKNPVENILDHRFDNQVEEQKKDPITPIESPPADQIKHVKSEVKSKIGLLVHKENNPKIIEVIHQQQIEKKKERKEVFYRVLDHKINISQLKVLQIFLKTMNFDDLIFKIIDYILIKYNIKDKQRLAIKNNIIADCIYCLIYIILRNSKNKNILLKNQQFTYIIKQMIAQQEVKFIKITFYMMHQLYANNYHVLLDLDENIYHKYITEQVKQVLRKFKDQKQNKVTYFIYMLDSLPDYFTLNGKNLLQNQVYITDRLIQNMTIYFKESIYSFCQEINKIELQKENNKLLSEQIVQPEIVAFMIFLRSLRKLIKNSNAEVHNYAKSLLQLDDIIQLLKVIDDFYPLKLELALYLTEAYINNEHLEQGEFKKLEKVFIIFLDNLKDFIFKLQHRQKYENVTYISQIPNIFDRDEFYNSRENILQINYFKSLEQYVIFGILRGYIFYQQRLSDNLIDNQISIMRQIHEFLNLFKDYWIDNTQFMIQVQDKINQRKGSKIDLQEFLNPNKIKNTKTFKQIQTLKEEKQSSYIFEVREMIIDLLNLPVVKKLVFHFCEDEESLEITKAFSEYRYDSKIHMFTNEMIKEIYEDEQEILLNNILDLKKSDNKKFTILVKNYIQILSQTEKNGVQVETKYKSMNVLRRIANCSSNKEIYELVQQDLQDLGFLIFLVQVIVDSDQDNLEDIMEYIRGMVDFLDDVSQEIQQSLYDYLVKDKQNLFILKLNKILEENFNGFRLYSKQQNYIINRNSNLNKRQNELEYQIDSSNHGVDLQDSINKEFTIIISQKQQNCIYILELIRLSCENHFVNMQNFIRQQINENELQKTQTINMIRQIAELFCKYSKLMNQYNLDLGIKILDTLIECQQGPCKPNQLELVHTKILEYLEDLLQNISYIELNSNLQSKIKQSISNSNQQVNNPKKIQFYERVLLFLLSLIDGNNDQLILNKMNLYINPIMLLKICEQSNKDYNILVFQIQNLVKSLQFYLEHHIDFNYQKQMNTIISDSNFLHIQQKSQYSLDNVLYEKSIITINHGFQSYILLQSLSNVSNQFKEKLETFSSISEEENQLTEKKKWLQYYKENCLSIEIINSQNQLQNVYFQRPPITYFLSSTTQQFFLENVDRNSSNDKIQGIYSNLELFHDEMNHYLRLSVYGLLLNLNALIIVRSTNLSLIFVQNMLMLSQIFDKNDDTSQAIPQMFGYIQLSSAILIWFLFVIMELPIQFMQFKRNHDDLQQKMNGQVGIFNYRLFFLTRKIIFGTHFFYLTYNIMISLLGLYYSKIFYSLLLLDIVDRSTVLGNVVKSITQNAFQLVMTAVLGLVIMYIYAVIGFFTNSIKKTFVSNVYSAYKINDSAWSCFTFLINIGLRSGGGIGDALILPNPDGKDGESDQYVNRYFYDLSFFLLMIIIWMNIVFGIIIDTFAELRDAKKNKDEDQMNICFICNKERLEFENENLNFQNHIEKEHNTWNYLYYLILLKTKNQHDFDGTQSYVFEQYQNGETSWFPIGRAMILSSQQQEDENGINKINQKLDNIQQYMKSIENFFE